MSHNQPPSQPSFMSQIDASHGTFASPGPVAGGPTNEQTLIMREILAAQDRQNELLEELVNLLTSTQKQRANELGQWKQANPSLARKCRKAAEALGQVQTEFLDGLTREVSDNLDTLIDGDFMLNEFVDRYGPRLAHLNGLLQVLSQLSSNADASSTPNTR